MRMSILSVRGFDLSHGRRPINAVSNDTM